MNTITYGRQPAATSNLRQDSYRYNPSMQSSNVNYIWNNGSHHDAFQKFAQNT